MSAPRQATVATSASAPNTVPPATARYHRLPPIGALPGCVHADQRRRSRWHLLAAAQRLLGGLLHFCRDVRLDVLESFRGDASLLQVFLVQPDRVSLSPAFEELVRQGLARLALVVGGVPAHPERLRDEQRRPFAPAAALGREPGGRVGIEHVVAVEGRTVDAVARRPLVKLAREVMLLEPGPQGHLVVLE